MYFRIVSDKETVRWTFPASSRGSGNSFLKLAKPENIMKYDFDELTDRKGSNSCKWDLDTDPEMLPMWVADMDFRTALPIRQAVEKRVADGIFGYPAIPEKYYEAVSGWFERRYGWKIEKEWTICTPGIVPALSAIIKALTSPGEKVIVQGPVYNSFYSTIMNNGCEPLSNPLVRTGDSYTMDYQDLEEKASRQDVRLMILCNPHNPAGRVWTREELQKAGEICLRHNVTVIADEIHCDLTYREHKYTPFASISEEFEKRCIVCNSASKTFNIAGLPVSNVICADSTMRTAIETAVRQNEIKEVSFLGIEATVAAYTEGEEWLEQLLEYLNGNYLYMKDFCHSELPDFPIAELEGTYLAWMDCRCLGLKSSEIDSRLRSDVKLRLNSGEIYGPEGEGFMRWNLACPRTRLEDGLKRFRRFVLSLKSE